MSEATPRPSRSVNVLGTRIAAINLDEAVAMVDEWAAEDRRGRYICVTGVHGVMEGFRNREIRTAHNCSDACVPDGMPMTWVGRSHGHRTMDRVYGPDLMLAVLELSARKGYTNFFYGGAEGVAAELKDRMTQQFRGLQVVGTYCPPFRPLNSDEREDLTRRVENLRPDFFWVGLSTPKQELFMHEFHEILAAKVMFGVGAAFDFHTGRVRQAPRWMMRAGLEWSFRLAMEPRRLGPRYLRNNPTFLWYLLLQKTGLRGYPLS